jgi:hypothetical protein
MYKGKAWSPFIAYFVDINNSGQVLPLTVLLPPILLASKE